LDGEVRIARRDMKTMAILGDTDWLQGNVCETTAPMMLFKSPQTARKWRAEPWEGKKSTPLQNAKKEK